MPQPFACYEIASYVVEATGFFEDKVLGGFIHFSNLSQTLKKTNVT